MKPQFFHIAALILPFSLAASGQDTLNQIGPDGKKFGHWIHYGREQPDKGYPLDGKISEGRYVQDRKEGKWITYHPDGVTPKTIGNFKDGRPNGEYQKITPEGWVGETGKYSDGKLMGDFKILAENGVVLQEKTFNEEGKPDGKIVFRYPNGQIELEAERVNGVATGSEIRYYENGDIKQITTYNADGSVGTIEEKPMENPPVEIKEVNSSPPAPDGTKGKTNRGEKFDPNNYNKIYNENEELWMDGKFKNGKLWEGKLYKYDSDGILLKIEMWKEGKYHSDGQL